MTIGTGTTFGTNRTTHAATDIQQALAEAAAGVSMRSVTKKYGPVTAVENITFDIPAGNYCCLLGPSQYSSVREESRYDRVLCKRTCANRALTTSRGKKRATLRIFTDVNYRGSLV